MYLRCKRSLRFFLVSFSIYLVPIFFLSLYQLTCIRIWNVLLCIVSQRYYKLQKKLINSSKNNFVKNFIQIFFANNLTSQIVKKTHIPKSWKHVAQMSTIDFAHKSAHILATKFLKCSKTNPYLHHPKTIWICQRGVVSVTINSAIKGKPARARNNTCASFSFIWCGNRGQWVTQHATRLHSTSHAACRHININSIIVVIISSNADSYVAVWQSPSRAPFLFCATLPYEHAHSAYCVCVWEL